MSSRNRGADYYAANRVSILEQDEDRIVANVRGTEVYRVEIELDEESLNVECSCPAFDSNGYCKHLWATFLAVDTAGYLPNATAKKLPYMPLGAPDPSEEFQYSPHSPFRKTPQSTWKSILNGLDGKKDSGLMTPGRHLIYVVDVSSSNSERALSLQVVMRERKLDGKASRPKKVFLSRADVPQLPNPDDVLFLSILTGAHESLQYSYYYGSEKSALSNYKLTSSLAQYLLPRIANTGRLYVASDPRAELEPLKWDSGEPFRFRLKIASEDNAYQVRGVFARGSEEYALNEALLITPGLVIRGNTAAQLETKNAFQLISNLKAAGDVAVPKSQVYRFIKEVVGKSDPEILDLSPDLDIESMRLKPRPDLQFRSANNSGLAAKMKFVYGDVEFKELDSSHSQFDTRNRRLYVRDADEESRWKGRFEEMGLRRQTGSYEMEEAWRVSRNRFPEIVRALLAAGCTVHAEGRHLRRSGRIDISIKSGIDWFELDGAADFEGQMVKFPDLLAALQRGENVVQLTDGSYGLIPEEWLRKYGTVAALGEIHEDHFRYRSSQVAILDAMLAMQPEATFDKTFENASRQLRLFDGIQPLDAPQHFHGTLRDYQKDALGWMKFLREFGFGGCLADDMGLGKTVMVLAMLEARRASDSRIPPSLVVVPRSLVFNWVQEASRFTPELRVLDYTGSLRRKNQESLDQYNLVLTTYGTLRSDAALLKDQAFDYIILDEAQAVKNASTLSAKAVRLLHGTHRLALSGTPVQNHLGDLWSLFDFLNPGMLGASSVLNLSGSGARKPDEPTVKLLAQALRPFILRRTKEQVAKELPIKSEQTIFCDLTPEERKLYDELRDHYRQSLLSRVDSVGLSRSKIQVLEALLRLRQAACHPGLIDPARANDMSTKLETLLPQLIDVMEEGHKALVFSQFVSFLAILRQQLDQNGISYQYLDGQTVDRQTPVETFQTNPDASLFLISLKAGGLGLNLTAADYVFLLDPWWNPVIEAQAIDRAHRIGQSRQVFAYRIIARDTVEEKVLQLQDTKRNLADAILTADNSVLRNIRREELELLLS